MKSTLHLSPVDGPNLRLRFVETHDSPYIHGLRTNSSYNRYLSPVTGTVNDQHAWIERYKEREAAGTEYYYVIERRDTNTPCGLVRLYNIEVDQFTWGSWILDENKTNKAALESALLVYKIGFDNLGKNRSVFDVRKDNKHTVLFHIRFGAQKIAEDEENQYFEYFAWQHSDSRLKYLAILGDLISNV